MSNELLKQEIERAMDNAPLQKALKNFTTAYPGNRERVYKDTISKHSVIKSMK